MAGLADGAEGDEGAASEELAADVDPEAVANEEQAEHQGRAAGVSLVGPAANQVAANGYADDSGGGAAPADTQQQIANSALGLSDLRNAGHAWHGQQVGPSHPQHGESGCVGMCSLALSAHSAGSCRCAPQGSRPEGQPAVMLPTALAAILLVHLAHLPARWWSGCGPRVERRRCWACANASGRPLWTPCNHRLGSAQCCDCTTALTPEANLPETQLAPCMLHQKQQGHAKDV